MKGLKFFLIVAAVLSMLTSEDAFAQAGAPGSGDCNGDGIINVDDALLALNHAVGHIAFSDEQIAACDIDGVNEVDTVDSLRILWSEQYECEGDDTAAGPNNYDAEVSIVITDYSNIDGTFSVEIVTGDYGPSLIGGQINIEYDFYELELTNAVCEVPLCRLFEPFYTSFDEGVGIAFLGTPDTAIPANTPTTLATLTFRANSYGWYDLQISAWSPGLRTFDSGAIKPVQIITNPQSIGFYKPVNVTNERLEITVDEDAQASVDLSSISDSSFDSIHYTTSSSPLKGTFSHTDNPMIYMYIPNADVYGNDEFFFGLMSGGAIVTYVSVFVTINPKEDIPQALSETVETNENETLIGKLPFHEPDNDPLTFRIVSEPTRGSLTLTDAATGAYEYVPNTDFSGDDAFTFVLNDGKADSNVGTVTLNINPASDIPPTSSASLIFSPPPGIYTETQTIEISCDVADAIIRHTTDGTDPDEDSPEYTAPVTVSETTVLKVVVYENGVAGKTETVTYKISSAGNINRDDRVDLKDLILALQVVAGMNTLEETDKTADLDGDQKIGLAEAVFVLREVAGIIRTD